MSLAQIETATTFRDALPCVDTFDRLENLFCDRRSHNILCSRLRIELDYCDAGTCTKFAKSKTGIDYRAGIVNALTRAELKLREAEDEIVCVASLLVAEQAAVEILATQSFDSRSFSHGL